MRSLYPVRPRKNKKGNRPASLQANGPGVKQTEFVSAVGDDSITRFDEQKKRRNGRKKNGGGRRNNNSNNNRRRSGNGGGQK